MTTVELLHALQARDIRLTVDGDRLTYDAPEGAITAEVLTLLCQHKTALLALLQQDHELATPSAEPSADDAPPLVANAMVMCTPQAHFPPTGHDSPHRQCQHCPHVWQVPC